MLEKLQKWLASHSITTHTIALFILALPTAYVEVPEFKALVDAVWAHLPHGVTAVLVVLWQLYSWYRRGKVLRDVWTPEQRAANLADKQGN